MVNFVLELWEKCQRHTGRPYVSSSLTLKEIFSDQKETMISEMIQTISDEFCVTRDDLEKLANETCAQKHAVLNFGVGDMKLCDLAVQLDAKYTRLGAAARSRLQALFNEKMAEVGFGMTNAETYLSGKYGLPAGRVQSIMLRILSNAPGPKLTSMEACHSFLDKVATDYASAHRITLSPSRLGAAADMKLSALTSLLTLISLKLDISAGSKPDKNLHLGEKNGDGLTAITLAADKGTSEMMQHIFNKLMTTQWTYGPVTCKVLPLEGIDFIHTKDGEKSVMEILVESDRLELFTLNTVQDLITRKWDKYAEAMFTNRLVTVAVYMGIFTLTELMPEFSDPNVPMFGLVIKAFGWLVIIGGAAVKLRGEVSECLDSGGIREHFSPKRACFMENVTSAGFLFFLVLSILGAQASELVGNDQTDTLSSVFKQAGDVAEAIAALFGWTNVYVSHAVSGVRPEVYIERLFGLAGTRIFFATRPQASSQFACSTCLRRT